MILPAGLSLLNSVRHFSGKVKTFESAVAGHASGVFEIQVGIVMVTLVFTAEIGVDIFVAMVSQTPELKNTADVVE
jgi:hypothetical protein